MKLFDQDRVLELLLQARKGEAALLSELRTWSDRLSRVEDKPVDLKSNYLEKR